MDHILDPVLRKLVAHANLCSFIGDIRPRTSPRYPTGARQTGPRRRKVRVK